MEGAHSQVELRQRRLNGYFQANLVVFNHSRTERRMCSAVEASRKKEDDTPTLPLPPWPAWHPPV